MTEDEKRAKRADELLAVLALIAPEATRQRREAVITWLEREPVQALVAPLQRFAAVWEAIPPLVRSSTSYHLAQWMHTEAARLAKNALSADGLMVRRGEVDRRFLSAKVALHELFVELCNLADAEARVRGIDQDVEPWQPSALAHAFLQKAMKDRKDRDDAEQE